jgi:dUTPase
VAVILFNHSNSTFAVKAGDRIAQLILERISTPGVVEVDALETTERGAGGFGSTGVKPLSPSTAKAQHKPDGEVEKVENA